MQILNFANEASKTKRDYAVLYNYYVNVMPITKHIKKFWLWLLQRGCKCLVLHKKEKIAFEAEGINVQILPISF